MQPGSIVENQDEVVAFLSDPATHGGAAVEEIETHGARIFLAGDRVYKLKRAVWYPFMDFSTLAKRRDACRAEIRLNRRTAPTVYLDAVPIVRTEAGSLALGGTGKEIDWVVVMARFDQDFLFDRMAQRGALDTGIVEALADSIARFHADAERCTNVDFSETMAGIVAGNRSNLDIWFSDPARRSDIEALDRDTGAAVGRCRDLMQRRSADGFVRRCHGDLHLRNICMIDGQPTLFDCIEFNESFATIDVYYDLAFLLMDLEHRGLRAFANLILNRYIARTGDVAGIAALPLCQSVRAAIRAHVLAATAGTLDDDVPADEGPAMRAEAMAYLDLARRLLDTPPPALVAVGGLSGSGKSTLARDLAPRLGGPPGALVVRSDVLRKRLAGADLFDRLPPDAYTAERNAAVYEALYAASAMGLAAGCCVITDAVFRDAGERTAIAQIAKDHGVPFLGLWLDVSPVAQEERLAARRADVSDATVEVGRAQRAKAEPIDDWQILDADQHGPALAAAAADLLRARGLPYQRSD
ncbi:MAG: AAA family ATPase [Alphaproteobacteria bacterium]|nr:AAA family ATPase [Alphaproteobacteria bacterium]